MGCAEDAVATAEGKKARDIRNTQAQAKSKKEVTDAAEDACSKLVVGNLFRDFFYSLCPLWPGRTSETAWYVGIS